MSDERKYNGNGLNGSLKYLAGGVAAIIAIASPFVALGGAKEKISDHDIAIKEIRSEISDHEKSDALKAEVLAGRLGSIQSSIDNQTQVLTEIKMSMSRMWQYKTEQTRG